MLTKPDLSEEIQTTSVVITPQHIDAFKEATRTGHTVGMPVSYATVYRSTEFQWLDRVGVDLRKLLHAEQEYEYLSPLKAGDQPVVVTRVKEWRERRDMVFVTLETDIRVGTDVKVRALSTFVVRGEKTAEAKV